MVISQLLRCSFPALALFGSRSDRNITTSCKLRVENYEHRRSLTWKTVAEVFYTTGVSQGTVTTDPQLPGLGPWEVRKAGPQIFGQAGGCSKTTRTHQT